MSRIDLRGVLPAPITPFDDQLVLDEGTLRQLVKHALTPADTIGVVVNAVAGEADALSLDERTRIVEVVRSEVESGRHVVAGIAASTAGDARAQVEAVGAAGADAVLLQAPASFARGIAEAPDVALRFVREVAEGGLPVILFQHQAATQRNYPLPLLLRLLEIENVVAVKETIWDVARYEQTVDAIRRERPDVQVLLANDTLLLPCMVSAMPDGLLLGFATLAGHEIGRLFRAVQAGDLDEARRLHGLLAPLRDAIYAPPSLNYYSRMKVALNLLGVLPNSRVRSPLVDSSPEEVERVRGALSSAGLL
ncbi:MAG: hypothetical protein JWM36_4866 [Hyphomicrobiales bacterium]|jgi:4-hydroxy-tetrahydrodipicolinate synthase|nr:hypothetical protein [Hyphomicrobiales bacterium]